MSNPTSNYGWQMPTATDLVTDLPADFEVFGQAVDTAMADLLGGTTGQILAKNSATNMDFVWITNDVGDITAVTAGTGISGGGTSGAVTVTNSMATEIAAKGDLIAGTGSATFDNLPVGTNGQVLTADSTVSPTGLKWATPSSTPTASACQAKRATDQTISNNTLTVLTFDAHDFDTSSYHSLVTNTERLTVPSTGYYLVNAQVMFATNASGYRQLGIFKNGTRLNYATATAATSATEATIIFNLMVSLTAADYLEIKVYQNSGGNLAVYGDTSNTRGTLFGITYLGA